MGIFKKSIGDEDFWSEEVKLWDSLELIKKTEFCKQNKIDEKFVNRQFMKLPSKAQLLIGGYATKKSKLKPDYSGNRLCWYCEESYPRVDLWRDVPDPTRFICRRCKKDQLEKSKKRFVSELRNFRKRDDYVPLDKDDKSPNAITDAEFDRLIEEFESGGWSGTRTWNEYKLHESHIIFLLRSEFARRKVKSGDSSRQKDFFQRFVRQPHIKTHYDILGVSRNSSKEEIKLAFKDLAKKWHPDKHKEDPVLAESMFKAIREAYEVLVDDEKRKLYDESIS